MMRSVGQLLRSRSEQSQTRSFEREWGRTSESRRPESLAFVVGTHKRRRFLDVVDKRTSLRPHTIPRP